MKNIFPRCELVPQLNHHVAFEVDGKERLGWNYDPLHKRCFFFPLIGPSGSFLTRFGQPNAPDHEHHKSLWFANHNVAGVNFWEFKSEASIQQKNWLVYYNSDEEAVMGMKLVWLDGHNPAPLIEQEVVASLKPLDDGESLIEIQSKFVPTSSQLEFHKTNFAFLGLRVARHLSHTFGGGELRASGGEVGEKAIFGKKLQWVDYSGPVHPNLQTETLKEEGITWFDHPDNPGYPNGWHVRNNGWFCLSPCMFNSIITTKKEPLVLRFLFHVHRGTVDPGKAKEIGNNFAQSSPYQIAHLRAGKTR
jgi:Family of unknown function (DUF6807)